MGIIVLGSELVQNMKLANWVVSLWHGMRIAFSVWFIEWHSKQPRTWFSFLYYSCKLILLAQLWGFVKSLHLLLGSAGNHKNMHRRLNVSSMLVIIVSFVLVSNFYFLIVCWKLIVFELRFVSFLLWKFWWFWSFLRPL